MWEASGSRHTILLEERLRLVLLERALHVRDELDALSVRDGARDSAVVPVQRIYSIKV